jgi:FMN reductase
LSLKGRKAMTTQWASGAEGGSGGGAIRIVGILGSVRPGNYTAKALALVEDELRDRPECSFEWLDPSGMTLPLPGKRGDSGDAERLVQATSRATGVILATPEYHGSFSSVMKLVIDNLGFPSALSGKPVALLGVAAGRIGAIKALEHLRSVASHVGGIVLPGPVSVARVRETFDEDGRCLDQGVERMIRGLGLSLLDYIDESICPRLALEAMVRE